jgi:hypothetical protein
VPADAKPGDAIKTQVVQRDDRSQMVGHHGPDHRSDDVAALASGDGAPPASSPRPARCLSASPAETPVRMSVDLPCPCQRTIVVPARDQVRIPDRGGAPADRQSNKVEHDGANAVFVADRRPGSAVSPAIGVLACPTLVSFGRFADFAV